MARAQALLVAGMLTVFQADYDQSVRFIDEALAVVRELNDPHLIGEAMTCAAFVAYREGDYSRATAQLREADRLLAGHPLAAPGALAIFGPGDVALAQEDFTAAALKYQEMISRLQASRYAFSLSDAEAGLAGVYFCTGRLPEAAALYSASLQRSRDRNFAPLATSALFGFAGLAAGAGQFELGARLLGAAEGMAERLGLAIFPRDLPVRNRSLTALKREMDEERLATLRGAGRTLSMDHVTQEAGNLAATLVAAPPGRHG
jgi:tetratricopeptide (TPR) repeat protein